MSALSYRRASQAIAALALLGVGVGAGVVISGDRGMSLSSAVAADAPSPSPSSQPVSVSPVLAADLGTFVRRWNMLNVSDEWPLPFDLDVSDGAAADTATHLFDEKSALMIGLDDSTGAVTDITFMASQHEGWLDGGEAHRLGDGLAAFMLAAHDEQSVDPAAVAEAADDLLLLESGEFGRALGGFRLLDGDVTIDGVEYTVVAGGGVGAIVTATAVGNQRFSNEHADEAARPVEVALGDVVAVVVDLDQTEHPESAAAARAAQLIALGHDAAVIESWGFPSLEPGNWSVFVGPFDSLDAAAAWCDDEAVRVIAPDCYPHELSEEPGEWEAALDAELAALRAEFDAEQAAAADAAAQVAADLAAEAAAHEAAEAGQRAARITQLRSGCASGDMSACDDLYLESDSRSSDETFGSTCGGQASAQYGGCVRWKAEESERIRQERERQRAEALAEQEREAAERQESAQRRIDEQACLAGSSSACYGLCLDGSQWGCEMYEARQ